MTFRTAARDTDLVVTDAPPVSIGPKLVRIKSTARCMKPMTSRV